MIEPGTKLGHYEIVEPIGQGGMGEVYRARDSRLGRDVAVKVSSDAFTERFQREARLVAAVNHPNICTLHDVGADYLVMELVEGPTLAERIAEGALPLDEARDIARQVAEALSAAHDAGIVHRDLKPGNIKVTPEGNVKVLDFGLAKDGGVEGATGDLSNSPTLSMAQTQAGMILGTAAYMAPEQARGRKVDKRADIWAFGVVLHEMLTGERLFQGDDVSDTLARVIRDVPDLSGVPQPVRRVLEKCLEKDPAKRLRDISGVGLLLEPPIGDAESAPEPVSRFRSWLWPAVAGVATVAAIVLALAPWRTDESEDRPLVRLNVELGSEFRLFAISTAYVSPDGERLAWVGSLDGGASAGIYTRRLAEADWRELYAGEIANDGLFFSPDSEWIGFYDGEMVNKISVEGGAAVPLARLAEFTGASWGTDGRIVASGTGLFEFSEDGGAEPVPLLVPGPGELAFGQPQILPDGESILFWVPRSVGQDGEGATIEIFDRTDQTRHLVQLGANGGLYLPTGHLLYHTRGTLFATGFDPVRRETFGSPRPILDDVRFDRTIGLFRRSISSDGTFVYASGPGDRFLWVGGATRNSTIEWLDRDGNRQPVVSEPDLYTELQLSPDDARIALSVGPGGDDQIAVYDPVRTDFTPFTRESGDHLYPGWTPDGRHVIFGRPGAGIYAARVDGAGPPHLLVAAPLVSMPGGVSPEARLPFVATLSEGRHLYTAALEDDGSQLRVSEPEVSTFDDAVSGVLSAFSPNGRWLAYQSTDSGQTEVYVRAFPPPATGDSVRFPISNGGGFRPVWSPNTDELFYSSLDGAIMVVDYAVEGDRFVAARPRVWSDQFGAELWDIGLDGRALVTIPSGDDDTDGDAASANSSHVMMLQNFFDYLEREVPLQ